MWRSLGTYFVPKTYTINMPEALMIRPKLVAVFDNIKDTINIMSAIYPKKDIDPSIAYKEATARITHGQINSFSKIN